MNEREPVKCTCESPMESQAAAEAADALVSAFLAFAS
jgi:hypothetical protein